MSVVTTLGPGRFVGRPPGQLILEDEPRVLTKKLRKVIIVVPVRQKIGSVFTVRVVEGCLRRVIVASVRPLHVGLSWLHDDYSSVYVHCLLYV